MALELSEAALVVGVAVAIDHPTQDNWVTVGGDALAIATGYAVGKVTIGPALGAVARKLAQREALAAEAAVAKAAADKLAAEEIAAKAAADKLAAEQAAANAAADKLAAEQAAVKAAEQQAKQERLSRDPQNGKVNAKSISEAATITQAEEAGLVNNPRRPDIARGEPNLDFAVYGPEPYKYCDVKTPVEPGKFRGTSAETQASRIAENIKAQKAGAKDVLHVVDLKNVPAEAKADFKAKVLDKLDSSQGVEFLND